MVPDFIKRILVPAFGCIAVTLPVVYIFSYIRKYRKQEKKDEDVSEVLFFCNQGIACRDHFQKEHEKKSCYLTNCTVLNLSRMLHYLNSAKRSLDVCLYLITVKELCEAIIRAHKRGVVVRVITDEDMANGSGSQIMTFWKNGLPVRHQHGSTTLMHHKFVVIDRRLVMTGSLNWTMQALCGNWDNLLITSQPQITTPFLLEFDRLWTSLK